MDALTARALAWARDKEPVPCRLCGDMLVPYADTRADEWTWADTDGHRSAVDADLRCLEPWGGAPGRLNWLSRGMDLLDAMKRTRGGEKVWLMPELAGWHHLLVMEYVSLKMRAEGVLATTHMHQAPPPKPRPCPPGFALPYHCGWPMRLAPSGWRCRQCTLATDTAEGLEIRERIAA